MWQKGLFLLAGVLVAPILKPLLKQVGRPLAREVIKYGLVVSGQVKEIVQDVREDFEDLTAEASAGLRAVPKPAPAAAGAKAK